MQEKKTNALSSSIDHYQVVPTNEQPRYSQCINPRTSNHQFHGKTLSNTSKFYHNQARPSGIPSKSRIIREYLLELLPPFFQQLISLRASETSPLSLLLIADITDDDYKNKRKETKSKRLSSWHIALCILLTLLLLSAMAMGIFALIYIDKTTTTTTTTTTAAASKNILIYFLKHIFTDLFSTGTSNELSQK